MGHGCATCCAQIEHLGSGLYVYLFNATQYSSRQFTSKWIPHSVFYFLAIFALCSIEEIRFEIKREQVLRRTKTKKDDTNIDNNFFLVVNSLTGCQVSCE